MIKSFGTRNFTSFEDWMELDFELNDQVPGKFHNGNNISNLLCLKGANASGKTNALKAIAFLSNFVLHSFNFEPNIPIYNFGLETFFGNKNAADFYIKFLVDNTEFLYEVSFIDGIINVEKIKKNDVEVFLREKNEVLNSQLFDNKPIYIRENASIISSAYRYPDLSLYIKDIYEFFLKMRYNVSTYGFTYYPDIVGDSIVFNIAKFYKQNKPAFDFMNMYLKKFDTGIESVEIEEKTTPDENIYYYPVFNHRANGKIYTLLDKQESSGTRALFHHLSLYFIALHSGGTLLLDEFDVNLHPDILPHLIDFFTNGEINKRNAQLIFTTHNTDIIQLVGKYRTYIFEKQNNTSICYRLDEIDNKMVRNDRSIINLYKKGLLGGIPKIKYAGKI